MPRRTGRRRRLPRILLNAATVVSLVLCVATVTLWVRSYSGAEFLALPPHQPGVDAPAVRVD